MVETLASDAKQNSQKAGSVWQKCNKDHMNILKKNHKAGITRKRLARYYYSQWYYSHLNNKLYYNLNEIITVLYIIQCSGINIILCLFHKMLRNLCSD